MGVSLNNNPESWVDSVYHPPKAQVPCRLEDILRRPLNYYSLGRWALVDALKACGIGAGDSVLVPGFICRDLLASIHAVGAAPMFYPVSDRMELATSSEELDFARAIVMVNYFGFPQDIKPFREYCDRTGAWLIEDNAHGLFSRDEDGRWLGTRGDLGIFSLRKSLALPNGAALTVHPQTELTMPEPPLFKSASDLRWRLKQGFRCATQSLDPRRTFNLLEKLRSYKSEEKFDDPEIYIPLPPEPCEELSSGIMAADPLIETQRRRELYELCEEALNMRGIQSVFPCLLKHTVPYGYPFYAEQNLIAEVRRRLARHGLGCLPWPDLPKEIEPNAPAHYRNAWMVHFLW